MNRATLVRGLSAALLIFAGAAAAGVGAASADVPPEPAEEFYAEQCAGTTEDDPRDADGPVPDLTRVWGERLERTTPVASSSCTTP